MSQKNPFAWGVVAIVLASACLFVALSTNGQKTNRPDSNTWRLAEPIRYENLSVFPVVSSRSANTGGFSTLDEALGTGEAVVTESGAMPCSVRGTGARLQSRSNVERQSINWC